MDKKQAYERVTAEYERRAAADRRLTALRNKLGAETVTLKDAHNYVDRSAELFGQAFGRTVLDIAQGEREGTCTALMRDRVSDIDEVSESVQSAVLARQGLNISPKSEAYPEKRIFTLAHSLEDPTATEEQITRRAESASATVLRARFDENMKKGAKTCAEAGLKTYIVRDGSSKCCPWCGEIVGRYVYGSEPKDVYRRHDNCSCSVVYESGRGRQNVWSKQYWSSEQEREYLRLRDEMAPKRLNARQAAELREQVGGLTFGGNGGRINTEKAFRKEGDDPMFEVTGRAIDSNPREIEEMEKRLKEWGVEINRGQNTLAYGSSANGRPGTMSITDDASFSAWKHEFKHAEDDKNAGWNAVYVLWNDPAEHERRERRAYEEEIILAREAGREDIAKSLEANRDAEIERIWKAYHKYHGDT